MASRRIAPTLHSSSHTLLRTQQPQLRNVILRRTYAESSQQSGSNHQTAGIIGGLVGGLAVFTVGYGYYHFSGAKTAVNYMKKGHAYLTSTSKSLQDSAPEPNEALQWLRKTSKAYAGFIPGASYYVDQAFNDLDAVHSMYLREQLLQRISLTTGVQTSMAMRSTTSSQMPTTSSRT